MNKVSPNIPQKTYKNDEVVIIGAGPAGMLCALELDKAKIPFTLIEKDSQVGGLSKTHTFGKFQTDNGPHRFYSKNKYLYQLIEELLGKRWIKVNRFTRFYIGGKFYNYPIEFKNVVRNLGLQTMTKAAIDYIKVRISFDRSLPVNFEEYVVSKFGKTLAEFNFINYTEKIWGLPCSSLSVDWARQRIKDLSIVSIVKNLLINKGSKPKTLVNQFYYPDLGTGIIYEEIQKKVRGRCNLHLNSEPSRIYHNGRKITKVVLNNKKVYRPKHLVSSIPINKLLQLLTPAPPQKILAAAGKLKFRSQVYLFITIKKPFVSQDQWIYFPEKEIPFGRISEMKNFSSRMSPKGKTSLLIEFFCWENDKTWNKTEEQLLDESARHLEKMNLLAKSDIDTAYLIRQKNVYPVYDLSYKKYLGILKEYLDKFDNLIYIGRPGRFKYTNQDHSMEMGIIAARSIIEARKIDIDSIGSEDEYFEKGGSYS